jgi:N-acetylglutamate synthase-like GNAT family acetyltransferase
MGVIMMNPICFIYHTIMIESWGMSIIVMETEGNAYGRLYQYNDDTTTIYFEGISVSRDCRKQGIGSKVLGKLEEISENLGATTLYLWVEKDTWMNKWYQRCGYIDFKQHEQEETYIWMKKLLGSE